MSIRKIAGLTAGFALTVGLLGAGVGAAFTDQVSAVQNIHVGTFGCAISSTSGSVSGKTLTYNAPDITNSAAGQSPFVFTVTNTGTIPAVAQVIESSLTAPFSNILTWPVADQPLAVGGHHDYAAGIQWTELWNDQQGQNLMVTYTVNCVEARTAASEGSTVTFASVDRGIYGSQDSVKFAGSGSGFTPGNVIDVQYAWAAGGPFDLASYWGFVGESAPVADGSGNFTYWFADNCHDGISYHTPENVVVTASDTSGHHATGTGILACNLMP
jgi:hypothetical protein